MIDHQWIRKQVASTAANARETIDAAERAVLRIDPKQSLSEQSQAASYADDALCDAREEVEAFFTAADDGLAIVEETSD